MRWGELAMKCRLLLVLLLLPTLAGPVRAGIIFGKKGKKPTPAERVPELLTTVKSDGDENTRARAVPPGPPGAVTPAPDAARPRAGPRCAERCFRAGPVAAAITRWRGWCAAVRPVW